MNSETKRKNPSQSSRIRTGCSVFAPIVLGLLCYFGFQIGLAPHFVYDFPERFLPPYCDQQLFADVIAEAAPQMRVINDLYGDTRVVALSGSGEDICFFRASTSSRAGFWPVTSPDGQYVAFTTNYLGSSIHDDTVHYVFIVNTRDGTYHFISDIEKDFEDLAWSPDSQQLAYTSYSGRAGWWQNTYIGSMSKHAEVNWEVSLGSENPYYWGYLEWIDEGNRLRYGHEEESVIGKPLPQPFWCVIWRDGSSLSCEITETDE